MRRGDEAREKAGAVVKRQGQKQRVWQWQRQAQRQVNAEGSTGGGSHFRLSDIIVAHLQQLVGAGAAQACRLHIRVVAVHHHSQAVLLHQLAQGVAQVR